MKDKDATIILDLKNKTSKEIFNGLDRSRRKNVKKAIGRGLQFKKFSLQDPLNEVYEIYSKVWTSRGIHPEEYTKWKKRVESPNYELFIIKFHSQIIGSALVEKITKKIYGFNSDEKGIRYHAFSSDSKFNDYRPNDFLYWSCIKLALENKLRFVDLGGYQINPRDNLKGVNNFKERWGGEILVYETNYPAYKALGRKLIKNSGFFWWLNKRIKGRK